MTEQKEIEIYIKYQDIKSGELDMTAKELAEDYDISRTHLYYIVDKVQKGDLVKLNQCTQETRLNCLWEHRYKRLYNLIPKNRKNGSIIRLQKLIIDMKEDGFTGQNIGKYLGKHHTTILHHLKK